jgi:rSAM/selenodomain-associated transferase 2
MSISIIVPAVNEAAVIAEQVRLIQRHGGSGVKEIIVVDGDSDDTTVVEARNCGAQVVHCAERSRAIQMNAGAQRAKGDVLFFVHADVQLVPSFVQDIEQTLQQGFDAGCYRYRFNSNRKMLAINAWFTRFDFLMFRGGDQTLFLRRDTFKKLGGFDERYSIMEDYDILIRLRKGHSFKIIQKDILVSARKYESNSWLRVQLANLLAFVMFRFKISPDKIKRAYKKMLNYRHDGLRN